MMPLIGRQALRCLNPKCVVQPADHEIELHLALVQQQTVPGFLWNFQGTGDDGTALAALGVNPSAKRKPVVETKIGDIARRYEPLPIEVACESHATDNIFGLTVHKLSTQSLILDCFAGFLRSVGVQRKMGYQTICRRRVDELRWTESLLPDG